MNYNITSFNIGDEVYHKSNRTLLMIVALILSDENEIVCEWLDKDGKHNSVGFNPAVLMKRGDNRLPGPIKA